MGKLYTDPDIAALREDNPTLGRNIVRVIAEFGDIDGQFIGLIRFTASDFSDRGLTIAWENGKANGINGIRASQAIAGSEVGSYVALFFTNSLDAWAKTIADLLADDEYLADMKRINFKPVARGIARRY